MRRLVVLALMLGLGSPASAQTPSQRLDAATARAIVDGCAAHAAGRRQSYAIAVTDIGGHLVAALRMDGNTQGMMEFAMAKARAAASWGFPTAGMAEAVKTTPGFAAAPYVVTVAGGVPVFSVDGKIRIGAVGASGGAQPTTRRARLPGLRRPGCVPPPLPARLRFLR